MISPIMVKTGPLMRISSPARLFHTRGVLILARQSKPAMDRALQRRENISGYLFMLPSLVFFLGFVVIPMIICIQFICASIVLPGSVRYTAK